MKVFFKYANEQHAQKNTDSTLYRICGDVDEGRDKAVDHALKGKIPADHKDLRQHAAA